MRSSHNLRSLMLRAWGAVHFTRTVSHSRLDRAEAYGMALDDIGVFEEAGFQKDLALANCWK